MSYLSFHHYNTTRIVVEKVFYLKFLYAIIKLLRAVCFKYAAFFIFSAPDGQIIRIWWKVLCQPLWRRLKHQMVGWSRSFYKVPSNPEILWSGNYPGNTSPCGVLPKVSQRGFITLQVIIGGCSGSRELPLAWWLVGMFWRRSSFHWPGDRNPGRGRASLFRSTGHSLKLVALHCLPQGMAGEHQWG